MSVREAALQLWKVGNQRVVLGDCFEVMRSIRPGSIDVVVSANAAS